MPLSTDSTHLCVGRLQISPFPLPPFSLHKSTSAARMWKLGVPRTYLRAQMRPSLTRYQNLRTTHRSLHASRLTLSFPSLPIQYFALHLPPTPFFLSRAFVTSRARKKAKICVLTRAPMQCLAHIVSSATLGVQTPTRLPSSMPSSPLSRLARLRSSCTRSLLRRVAIVSKSPPTFGACWSPLCRHKRVLSSSLDRL